MQAGKKLILLTGSTGYVGGRLLPRLLAADYPVRCLTRRPDTLAARLAQLEHADRAEIFQGDLRDRESLAAALEGVDTAYYFVHSMGEKDDFEEEDRQAAENFVWAVNQAGTSRVIYLGGLGRRDEDLSKHLRSRQEVGRILRRSSAQVIEFRASIVLGSGSLSFELIRALVERLPIMICPRWVRVVAQPIAIEDLLDYLLEALQLSASESTIYEIGGPEQVSYGEIMHEYAHQRGLHRMMIPVPVLTPYLSSLWLGFVTPVYARIGRKLVDSLRNPTVVTDDRALSDFAVRPRGLRAAIERALANEDRRYAETRWSDAISSAGNPRSWGGVRLGSRLFDSRSRSVAVGRAAAFGPIERIGGSTGWYFGNWLWRIRGFLDLLVGGVGVRRGRRDPNRLRVGDTVDFWRVERVESERCLRLRAEMKVPGRAWLEFTVGENPDGEGTTIHQTAVFDPKGLFGLVYWYALFPIHQVVFHGMLKNIARAAEAEPARLRRAADVKSGRWGGAS